jgi:hypothetical protein
MLKIHDFQFEQRFLFLTQKIILKKDACAKQNAACYLYWKLGIKATI